MIIGSVCLSHSPLMDRNRASPEVEEKFNAYVNQTAQFVAEHEPDLTIIFYPDHFNGFFYKLMPAFCVGLEGTALGDYGTAAGVLDIPENIAADLARSVLDAGIDWSISYQMQVDHGAIQPLEWLSEMHSLHRVIPVFVNCASPPLPTFARARALGAAVGEWAAQRPERILIIGSGGLSHDPPMPALAQSSPEMRDRLISGHALKHSERYKRQSGAHREGVSMGSGKSQLLPINTEWDGEVLEAFASGNLTVLDDVPESELARTAGRGAQEVRTWVAALAALGDGYTTSEPFYAVVEEWITGMGMLRATPA